MLTQLLYFHSHLYFQLGLICVFSIGDVTSAPGVEPPVVGVPGCTGYWESGKDYCASPQDLDGAGRAPFLSYKANAGTENQTWFSYSPQLYLGELGLCEGDCDIDAHCADGFHCFRRSGLEPVDDGVTNCNGVGAQGKGASLFFFDCS